MKKVFILFVMVLIVSLTQKVLAKGANECDQGVDCTNVVDSSGKKNGVEICKSGKVTRRKIMYKDDLREGLWECFDQNGKLIESRIYKNNKMNGVKRLWLSNIEKFEESEYKDDEIDGFVTTYDTSHSGGQTKITGINKTSFRNGVMHGLQIIYDSEGIEKSRFCYDRGQRVSLEKQLCLQKK